MKYYFIVNPVSGKGKGNQLASKIRAYCQEKRLDYELIFTAGPKDATVIAKNIKEPAIIFSVGGDGTLAEVAAGVYGSNNLLGVIPGGSGNDYYRSLQEKEDGEHVSSVYEVNGEIGINVLNIGFDADINDNTYVFRRNKFIPPNQVYNAAILYTFMKYNPKEVEITIDGKTYNSNMTLCAVANGKYYGAGFHIAPKADISEEYLDVILVEDLTKLQILSLLGKLKKGTHINHPKVHTFKAKKIKIKSKLPISCARDGEHLNDKYYKIKVKSKQIRVFNNKQMVKDILNYND